MGEDRAVHGRDSRSRELLGRASELGVLGVRVRSRRVDRRRLHDGLLRQAGEVDVRKDGVRRAPLRLGGSVAGRSDVPTRGGGCAAAPRPTGAEAGSNNGANGGRHVPPTRRSTRERHEMRTQTSRCDSRLELRTATIPRRPSVPAAGPTPPPEPPQSIRRRLASTRVGRRQSDPPTNFGGAFSSRKFSGPMSSY